MAQKNAVFIPMADKKGPIFTGGIVDNSEPNVIPNQNSPFARNFRVNAGGISIRPGYYTFASLTGTGAKPFGIANYQQSASSNLLVGYKSDATHYLQSLSSTGAQTPILTDSNITSENRMNFLSTAGNIYCMNGVDIYGKLSGTTYTIPSTGVTDFKPSFGVFFNNCGWVSGNSTAPSMLYKSPVNNLDSYSGTGSDSFSAAYPITGLGVNQQSLYVFTRYTIDVFNTNSINQVGSTLVYQSKPLEATEGCINHNLIVSIGKGIFYISPSNKIRQIAPTSFGMYDFTELSHRIGNGITKTMEALDPDQSKGFGYAIPKKQIICWHLKSMGATNNDTVVVYNYEFDEWMVDTNKSFGGGTLFDSSPYAISGVNPTVYMDEFGTTDDDSPIQFRYDTKWFDLGEPTILKCLWQVRLFLKLNPRGKIYQEIYADGSLIDSKLIDSSTIPQVSGGMATEQIGTFPIGTEGSIQDTLYNTAIVRDKGYLRVKAKTFYISYVSYESGTQCLIQKLQLQLEQLNYLTSSHF